MSKQRYAIFKRDRPSISFNKVNSNEFEDDLLRRCDTLLSSDATSETDRVECIVTKEGILERHKLVEVQLCLYNDDQIDENALYEAIDDVSCDFANLLTYCAFENKNIADLVKLCAAELATDERHQLLVDVCSLLQETEVQMYVIKCDDLDEHSENEIMDYQPLSGLNRRFVSLKALIEEGNK